MKKWASEMKKLKNWFSGKKKDPYFQQDDQGRDIYYPWGNAGDCYYLGNADRAMLIVLSNTSKLIAVLLGILFVCWVPVVFFINIFVVVPLIIAFTWFVLLSFYQATLEPSNLGRYEMSRKTPQVVISTLELGVFHALVLFLVSQSRLPHVFIPETALFVLAFDVVTFWLFWRRKGFIFQKKVS